MFALWLALVTLTWAAVAAQVRFEREEALTNAGARARNLAIAFEQYTIRTLEGAEGVIRAVVREYAKAGAAIDLAALVEGLALDRSSYEVISIVDVHGFVATSALAPPLERAINIGDREDFAVHRDRILGQLFVGRPVRSRRSGHDVIPVTHRLSDGAGRFAGIVSVQFAPAAFTAFYREATQGPRDILSLVGRDGVTRARRVGDEASAGEDIADAQLMREWAERPVGMFTGPGGLDGVTRVFSYRTVGTYPLVVTVGLAVNDILATARARQRTYVRAASLATIGLTLSAMFLVTSMVRRREMFDRLAASNARFKSIFDHAGDAMLLADNEARCVDANPSACRMLGYAREELIGRTTPDVVVNSLTTETQAEWDRFRRDGEMQGETHLRRKDGALVDVEFRAVADIEPGVHLSVLRDVTQRHVAEQHARRVQRLESLGTLAGGIAHDINNSLTPILLSAEILRESETDPSRVALLDGIETSARRGAHMVQQVLLFARGVEGARVDVSLAKILREVEAIANDTFLKHIRIETDIAADLGTVAADPTQMHQVVLNLCVNARDAMPDGGRLLLSAANVDVDEAFAAEHPGARPGQYVRVIVQDSGAGMAPELLERVFDPFFTTKPFGQGTGLGLSTSLAIVQSHGGFMWMESDPGHGTRAHVCLPVGHGEARGELPSDIPPPHVQDACVLVIDDEGGVREAARRTLEAHGYRVRLASSGAEGVAAYAAHRDDTVAVLTDMMMPDMDGSTTIVALRRIDPHVVIIAATGLPEEARVARAIALGASQVIAKPYTTTTLLRALHEAVAQVRA